MTLDAETIQIFARLLSIYSKYQLKDDMGMTAQILRTALPEDETVKLAHAAACVSLQENTQARSILEGELLAANRENAAAKALLCIVNDREGNTHSNAQMFKEIHASGDADAIELISTLQGAQHSGGMHLQVNGRYSS